MPVEVLFKTSDIYIKVRIQSTSKLVIAQLGIKNGAMDFTVP